LKTYYELLGVGPATPADDIKRAFRREIARYHPDKVQHLGPEFQEIAATRAAELTEAYRILMDPAERQKYDESLGAGAVQRPAPAGSGRPSSSQPPRYSEAAPAAAHTAGSPSPEAAPETLRQTRTIVTDVVKKATLARLRDAVQAAAEPARPLTVTGFDAAYATKAKTGLFRKGDPAVRLLARIVPVVDRGALEEAWPLALRAGEPGTTLCLLLMGATVAPSKELSAAVADLRRKSRHSGPVLVPVDFRDWEALFPPETPDVVRSLIQRLKQEK
jgi:hypothetical protein